MVNQSEEFISEPIEPAAGTFDTVGMSRGEPGLPARFTWRGRQFQVAQLLEKWKSSGPCKSGSPEIYLRKHWFRVRTTDNLEMTLYFERQSRSPKQLKTRRWLFTVKTL